MESIRNLIQITSKVYHLLFVLVLTIALPFVVHLFPSINGVPIGAILLPMFYISIPSMYLFKDSKLVSLGVGLAPVINHLMTGRPDISLMIILTFELVVYSFIVSRLLSSKYTFLQKNVGGFGYLFTKSISSLSLYLPFKVLDMGAKEFFINSITNALPGILILCLISNISYIRLRENA